MSLASLTEAIEWCQSKWHEQRPVPTRLHTRETEGVGLFYAHPFQAALDGSPDAVTSMPQTQPCYHPTLMARMSPRDCPECLGLGVKETRVDRYVYPFGLALAKLRSAINPQPRHPHPAQLIVILAEHNFDPRAASVTINRPWEIGEALFLGAIRLLHSRYSAGPVSSRTRASASWIELSDSQKSAIIAGETAA